VARPADWAVNRKRFELELIPFRGRSAASVVKPLHGGISSRS